MSPLKCFMLSSAIFSFDVACAWKGDGFGAVKGVPGTEGTLFSQ